MYIVSILRYKAYIILIAFIKFRQNKRNPLLSINIGFLECFINFKKYEFI
jgi:hypothetical protein